MITSVQNAKVKKVAELQSKAKVRREEGLYIVEGRKMFLEAPTSDIEECYVLPSFIDNADEKVRRKLESLSYETVSDEVFMRMSDTKTPQGVLLVLRMRNISEDEIIRADNTEVPLILVLEELQDPGNLGTIIRTAEGAGVTGIIASPGTVDRFNPKAVRSSMGSLFRMPYALSEDIHESLGRMKKEGITVYAAHLLGTSYHYDFDYRKPSAFLIGNEGNGLRKETADKADTYVRIPMEGKVESLNAGIAAALLMYEANRQRRQK